MKNPWKGLLLILLLAGCATRPDQQIYVLGAAGEPAAGVRDDTGRPVIEVRRVLVPDYLDSTDITLRTGTNELQPSRTGVWGERLSVGITQALAGALARRVPSAVVVARPPVNRPAVQVLVDVSGLRATAGGDAVLTAHWTVLRFNGAVAPRTMANAQGSFVAQGEGSGDAAVVTAIGNVIDQLADRIAAGLP